MTSQTQPRPIIFVQIKDGLFEGVDKKEFIHVQKSDKYFFEQVYQFIHQKYVIVLNNDIKTELIEIYSACNKVDDAPWDIDIVPLTHFQSHIQPETMDEFRRFYDAQVDDLNHTDSEQIREIFIKLLGKTRRPYKHYDTLEDFVKTSKSFATDCGKLRYDKDGEIYINIGKHKGKLIKDLVRDCPDYIDWIKNEGFLDTLSEGDKYDCNIYD